LLLLTRRSFPRVIAARQLRGSFSEPDSPLHGSANRFLNGNNGSTAKINYAPDSLQPPDDGSGEANGGHECFDVAIEAGSDAPPVFEAAEHAVDDVALLVDCAIIIVLDFAALAGWNDGFSAALDQLFSQRLTVVAFVGDQFGRRRHRLDAELGDLAIVNVSGRQKQDTGATLLVADGVELGVSPAFRADIMSQAPPFPPPAQR